MHSEKKVLVGVLFFFVFALLVVPSASVLADVDSSDYLSDNGCNPVDVVFIMGAPVSHIEWVFDALAIQRLNRCRAADQVSRVGVVTTVPPQKSNGSYVVMPLTPLSPSSISVWEQQRKDIYSQLESASYIDDPRNIKAGFEAAFDMLVEIANSTSNTKRQAVLIYIGYPVTSLGSDIATVYLEGLRELISIRSNELTNAQPKIYAILTPDHGTTATSPVRDQNYLLQSTMKSSSGNKQGWDLITDQFGGKYYPTSGKYFIHDWQIANAVLDALRDSTGLQVEPFNCGEFIISPYQGSMEVYFFTDNTDIQIQVEKQEQKANLVQIIGEKSETNDLNMVFPKSDWKNNNVLVFTDPLPGSWRVNVLGGKCDAMTGYRISGFPDVEVISPKEKLMQYAVGGEKFDPDDTHYLKLELRDPITGLPLALWRDYPPEMKGDLIRSDGVKESINFEIDKNNLFQSEPLNVVKDGLYEWTLDLSLPTLNSNGVLEYKEVISGIMGEYNVQEIREVQLQILQPEQNEKTRLHAAVIPGLLKVLPIEVKVDLKDKAGNALNANDIFVDPAKGFKASLIEKASGKTIGSQTYLSVSEENESVLVGKVGGGWVNASSGEYIIVISPDGKVNDSKYRVVNVDSKRVIIRKDGLFSWPPLWYGIFGVICLTALGYFGYYVSLFFNPLSGEIHFRRMDSERPFFILKLDGKRIITISKNDLAKKSPILSSIDKIKVSHESKNLDDEVELFVFLNDKSIKRKVLKVGETLLINNIIEAVYMKFEAPLVEVNNEKDNQTLGGEDKTDE